VSAPLQAFVFSSYLLNVLLQLANKNGIKKKNYAHIQFVFFFFGEGLIHVKQSVLGRQATR
jgi:hypothetical protein